MTPISSPTPRLLVGFGAIIFISVISSLFVVLQLRDLRGMQSALIERNRRDSHKLLRIQQQANALGEALRDVATVDPGRSVEEWRTEMARIRSKLERTAGSNEDLRGRESLAAFDRAAKAFDASSGTRSAMKAREGVIAALQKQQAILSGSVAELMEYHNEVETSAAQEVNRIYDEAERNRYVFLAVLLVVTGGIAAAAANYNRHIFARLRTVSEERQMLARGLITVQEEVLRTVSRELHDEFGQILTAMNALLHRAGKKHLPEGSPARADLDEVRAITQETLEKTREFSQSLRPAILDDYGLAKAIERQVAIFERHYGIATDLEMVECGEIPAALSIHVYRVLQEALSNVVRHARATAVTVKFVCAHGYISLEILDNGIGINGSRAKGLGLIAMRERAELLRGWFSVERRAEGGTRVILKVPVERSDE